MAGGIFVVTAVGGDGLRTSDAPAGFLILLSQKAAARSGKRGALFLSKIQIYLYIAGT
jgi:hypothetical protein